MADRLGIRVHDRDALAGEIAAVLRREPDAVGRTRRDMEALRDRAAGDLAFERAAKIQAEIAALDWITCPQRVAVLDGPDLTVQGWADGVLVEWTMRAAGSAGGGSAVPASRGPPRHRRLGSRSRSGTPNSPPALCLAESKLKRA
jgi:hypothetical protein